MSQHEKLRNYSGHEASDIVVTSRITNPRVKATIIIASTVILIVVGVILVIFLVAITSRTTRPKNLIMLVGDGFGPASITFARTLSGKPLHIDNYLVGTVRTYSADSRVTDSAAGATAWSCGVKTLNGAVGVDAMNVPCGTLLEAAQMKNMRVGLVSTSEVTHATPASFSSHSVSRDYKAFIAEQQVNHTLDVQFGGALRVFQSNNGILLEKAIERGIQIITDVTTFRNDSLQIPVLGLFALDHMDYEIDRDPNQQPSLDEMAAKAIELLNADNKEGFFLMIEGSRIDMAGHRNDIAAHYRDIIAFDKAIGTAIDFAQKSEDTLVIIVADHETGGLGLGYNDVYDYDSTDHVLLIEKSVPFICNLLGNNFTDSGERLAPYVLQYAKLNLSDSDKDTLNRIRCDDSLGQIISNKLGVAWTTLGHTGVDINLYAYGKQSLVTKFIGNQDNTDIGHKLVDIFEWDLEAVTESLKDFDPNPSGIRSATSLSLIHI
eukprot:TRINITY_DN6675_c0_g1_i2.p1 TRINITY_DN6675_c0_g1~~TRINITY_DN6675_c0_g1_i2.p1  ORF type:complete len:502 (-),score=74.50 TRINITY_DN6675_c0_g1_i2:23-1495(-)